MSQNFEKVDKVPKLVDPSAIYKESYLAGLKDLQAEGRDLNKNLEDISADFGIFLDRMNDRARGVNLEEGKVPQTEQWLVLDNEWAGALKVRHYIDRDPPLKTGHIGYEVAPKFRGRGYATFMLQEALKIAKNLGLREVVLATSGSNAASQRVIEKCGGILQNEFDIPGEGLKRRYKITLD